MARSTLQASRLLASVAHGQGGYFTAKQAIEAGYNYPHLDYHISTGSFERVEHGLYRLAHVPRTDEDEFIRLSLWSRNQKDEPQAVVSHHSALALHDLTELIPGQVHLTVPPTFRKVVPEGCVLHKAALTATDTEERAGFRVTTPLRTLLDAAADDVSTEQLEKALAAALARGLVRRKALEAAAEGSRGLDRLGVILSVPKAGAK